MATNKAIISPTLVGGVVVVLASVAGFFGIDVTATEQAELVTHSTSAITAIAGLCVIGRNLYAKKKQ